MTDHFNQHPTDKIPTDAPTRTSAIQRLLNAWRHWEEIMDHSPLDYSLDRIRQLEGRVTELERARNGTVEMPHKAL